MARKKKETEAFVDLMVQAEKVDKEAKELNKEAKRLRKKAEKILNENTKTEAEKPAPKKRAPRKTTAKAAEKAEEKVENNETAGNNNTTVKKGEKLKEAAEGKVIEKEVTKEDAAKASGVAEHVEEKQVEKEGAAATAEDVLGKNNTQEEVKEEVKQETTTEAPKVTETPKVAEEPVKAEEGKQEARADVLPADGKIEETPTAPVKEEEKKNERYELRPRQTTVRKRNASRCWKLALGAVVSTVLAGLTLLAPQVAILGVIQKVMAAAAVACMGGSVFTGIRAIFGKKNQVIELKPKKVKIKQPKEKQKDKEKDKTKTAEKENDKKQDKKKKLTKEEKKQQKQDKKKEKAAAKADKAKDEATKDNNEKEAPATDTTGTDTTGTKKEGEEKVGQETVTPVKQGEQEKGANNAANQVVEMAGKDLDKDQAKANEKHAQASKAATQNNDGPSFDRK